METNALKENNSIQLISIDSSQNLKFYEQCKLKVDKITKHLIVKPSDEETDFIYIDFKRTFLNVLQYILCADKCDTDTNKYLIIFPTFEKFASFIETINQKKTKFKLYISVIKNDQLFQEEFLIQILNQCKQNEELEENLKAIISQLFEFYKPNQQQNNDSEGNEEIATNGDANENNENLSEIGDNDSDKCDNNQISVIMEDESENIVVEGNVLQVAVEDMEKELEENEPQTAINFLKNPQNFVPGHVLQDAVEDVEKELEENVEPQTAIISSAISKDAVVRDFLLGNSTNTGSILSNQNVFNDERLKRRLKRSCQELKICEQVYCNKNSEPKPKKQKSNHLIYAPNFIFKHFIRNGQSRSRLFIFPTADKKLCYEYFYDFNREKYMCCGCNNKKRQTSATIEEDENGEDFVKCIRIDHICKLRPFNLDKWESDLIIKAPNFRQITEIIDGESKKFLLLFTSADKKKFFKFAWDHGQQMYKCMECAAAKKRTYIQACIRQDQTEFVYVRNQQHICSKMKYINLESDNDNQSLMNVNQKFKPPESQWIKRNSSTKKVLPRKRRRGRKI